MVLMLAVTFSPVVPSPRVAAVTSFAAFVAQRHGQAVDLGLGGEDELGVGRQAEEPPHCSDEVDHVLVGKDVVEREHRPGMLDLRKGGGWSGAHPREGESSRISSGKFASMAALRSFSASYSASETTGASSA